MLELNSRGSLLFETFVALMFLSIAAVSALRLFGQSLFTSQSNLKQREAQAETNHLLFSWFAYPAGVTLPEAGELTVALESQKEEPNYWGEIHSKILSSSSGASETNQATTAEESRYYQVKLQTLLKDRKRKVLDLDAVVYQAVQAEDIE